MLGGGGAGDEREPVQERDLGHRVEAVGGRGTEEAKYEIIISYSLASILLCVVQNHGKVGQRSGQAGQAGHGDGEHQGHA